MNGRPSAVADLVDRADIRMLEAGGVSRLAHQPLACVGIRELRAGAFDRDRAAQLRISRAVNLAHPARSDKAGDFVVTQTRPNRKAERRCRLGGKPPAPSNARRRCFTEAARRPRRFRAGTRTSRSRSTSPPHASARKPRTLSVRNIQGVKEYGFDACPPRIPFRITDKGRPGSDGIDGSFNAMAPEDRCGKQRQQANSAQAVRPVGPGCLRFPRIEVCEQENKMRASKA